jgi:hypothetical protein
MVVGFPLNGLIPPHCCACPNTRIFSTICHGVLICSMV